MPRSAAWGVLISFEKAGKHKQAAGGADPGDDGDGSDYRGGGGGAPGGPRFVVDVLVSCDPASLPRGAGGGGGRELPRLLPPGAPGGAAHVVTFPLEHLAALSSARMRALQDLRPAAAREALLGAVAEVVRRQPGGEPPLLDPQGDMKVGAEARTRARGWEAGGSVHWRREGRRIRSL